MSTSRKLIRNTLFMYIRMGVLLCISLYTSRVLLRALGVEDFGVYNLVGSILAVFTSLRTLFATSTERFLNYEMGQGNHDRLQLVYNTSLLINLAIAVVYVLAVELLAVWFFETRINIDPGRMPAARAVLHISLASAVLSIFTTTYDAEIIAHERMDFYAYISIAEGILKLLIVYLLVAYGGDRLVLYAVLMLCTTALVLLINWGYCRLRFSECRFHPRYDRAYLRRMMSFAGWQFFGNSAYALTHNGLNMVLNIFGGVVANAARGIAYQVYNALSSFQGNIIVAIEPHCIQACSRGDYREMFRVIFSSTKLMFAVQLCVVTPFIFFTSFILLIWLGKEPPYTVIFIQIVLLNSILRALHNPIHTIFTALGRIKHFMILEGLILSLPILLGYLALRAGQPIYMAFVYVVLCEMLNLVAILLLANRIALLDLRSYAQRVLLPVSACLLILLVSYACYVSFAWEATWQRIALVAFIELASLFTLLKVGLSEDEHRIVNRAYAHLKSRLGR